MVDIFRASEHCLSIVEEAVAIKAKSIWMQIGISHQQARAYAEQAGLIVVEINAPRLNINAWQNDGGPPLYYQCKYIHKKGRGKPLLFLF